jgi:hypothetical protein
MISGREPGRDELRAAADSVDGLARLAPNATPQVRSFIAHAIATERSDRFGNADQMLRALLELQTPWSTDPEPAPAATQPQVAAGSQPPAAEPAHAEFEGSATSEFLAQTEQPAVEASSDDFELRPIGLVARLRARKRMLLIAGGALVLGGAGAGLAMFLEQSPLHLAAVSGEDEAAAKGAKKPAAAKSTPKDEHESAEDEEEEEDDTEAEGEGTQAADNPGEPVAAAPEPLKLSARLGSGEEEQKPAEAEASEQALAADPSQLGAMGPAQASGPQGASQAATALAQGSQITALDPGSRAATERGSKAAAQPGSPAGTSQGAGAERGLHTAVEPGSLAAASRPGVQPPAAERDSHPAQSAQHGAQSAVSGKPGAQAAEPGAEEDAQGAETGQQPMAAEHGAADPGHANDTAHAEHSAAASDKAMPGAAAKAAEPEKPKPPTPEELGSERHIEPDRSEIRQMLALAVAPKPRGAAKNPWDISVPDSLQALRDSIASGERGSAGNIKTLRRYNSANPDDVYGHLLLAGFYANRGYSLDALDQLDMAYRIDPSSRGAPEMLKHALDMVAQGIAERDAIRFIDRVYGREAQAGIAARLRARETSPAAARRLKQLQSRLARR